MVGQSGELRGVGHVNAAGRGDIAEAAWGGFPGLAGGLVDNFGSVVRLGFGVLPEHQLVTLNHSPVLPSLAPLFLQSRGQEGLVTAH